MDAVGIGLGWLWGRLTLWPGWGFARMALGSVGFGPGLLWAALALSRVGFGLGWLFVWFGFGWVGLVNSEPDLQGRFCRTVLDHLHSCFVVVT